MIKHKEMVIELLGFQYPDDCKTFTKKELSYILGQFVMYFRKDEVLTMKEYIRKTNTREILEEIFVWKSFNPRHTSNYSCKVFYEHMCNNYENFNLDVKHYRSGIISAANVFNMQDKIIDDYEEAEERKKRDEGIYPEGTIAHFRESNTEINWKKLGL